MLELLALIVLLSMKTMLKSSVLCNKFTFLLVFLLVKRESVYRCTVCIFFSVNNFKSNMIYAYTSSVCAGVNYIFVQFFPPMCLSG